MNILVTWCAWFIWSNIVEKLINDWENVIWLDNLEYWHYKNISEFENNMNFKFIKWDIRDFDFIDKLLKDEKITHICHQAARWSVPKSIDNPILTNDINVNWTLNLLWAANINKVEKFVCAISSSIYWNTPSLPKIETMEYNPISPYAITKVTKELYCKLFYSIYWLKTIWLRYFNVYWKKQDPNWPYAAIVPRWISNAYKNENLPLNWEWNQTRDFTYIDDVVEANILSLKCDNIDAFWKWYNICYWEQISIKKLWEVIINKTNSKWVLVKVPARKWDINDSLWSLELAHNLLWYSPKIDIEKWIEKTLDWYKNNIHYFENL